jgi:hypothetical protein
MILSFKYLLPKAMSSFYHTKVYVFPDNSGTFWGHFKRVFWPVCLKDIAGFG